MTESEVAAGPAVFAGFSTPVRRALSVRGFSTPTETQRRAIPPIVAGDHTLVIAPTGTGKTETAMLPVLDAIVRSRRGAADGDETTPFGISVLYVTPLRALNRDMRDRLEWWGETLDLAIDVRHGDTTRYRRQQQANDPPDVLVTTPETLQAMLTGSKLRKGLSDVEHVVVDEVHELAASKRGAQLSIGLERLVELAGSFQRIGLSATVGDPEAVGAFLTGNRDCEVREIEVGSRLDVSVSVPRVTDEDERLAGQLATDPAVASHVRRILEIVEENESTLIFVNTRQTAEALGSRFLALDANVGVHHGSLSSSARIEVEDAFKAGDLDALLCTSSMELGIDVGRIDHVVQYGSPREVARLLQRVGRAGHRMDEVSEGTIVATRPDDALESLAIVDRARRGAVEPAAIHHGSLDTLANQLVGMAMDEGEITGARAYEIATRAAPFSDVDRETFRSVIRELATNRIVWLDEEADRIEKTGGTWQYYYANLSMIPDETTYEVADMASGRGIGTLDERFVVTFAAPGAVFVQRGEMWRIVEVDEDRERVQVTPVEDPVGEIPSWVGQEIPVPLSVAQSVAAVRRETAERLADDGELSAAVRDLVERYPTDHHTARVGLESIGRQVETDKPVPTDETIVVEFRDDAVVVNACLGHSVNETIGRALCALLGQRTGSSIGLDVDPYRIELTVPRDVTAIDVVSLLRETNPDHVGPIIELSLKRSATLAFTLTHVATKFGALKRWEGRTNRFPPDRLLEALSDTPMYEEAIREVFHEQLDVSGAARVLESIRSGKLALVSTAGRTPIGLAGRSGTKELLAPENADASVVKTVRERIQNDRVILLCLHCQEWTRRTTVERVPDRPTCPDCGSTRIAALNPWDEETVAAVRAAEKDDEQDRLTRRAYRAANLVQSHGKRAVIALAARGVGPENAARIIAKLRENEDDFYRDIIARERQYARTKAFWD